MDIIYQISKIIEFILITISTIEFLITSILIIILYHIFFYVVRDRKYIAALIKYEDNNNLNLNNFESLPLINIIIPAWKEGDTFRKCLENVFSLEYPSLKVFVNVGGNEETISIAESFKNANNYTILFQEKGGGKVKAINDCISQVKEGLICLIDADIFLKDEDLLKMLYVIQNKNESIVISFLKPHSSQVKKSFVRYLYINRNALFRNKFQRYARNAISQCTLLKLEVIKKVGKFTEKRLIGDGKSIGFDIMEQNFKIYQLNSKSVQSFNFPLNLKEYFSQNVRWIQNLYYNVIKKSKKRTVIFIFLTLEILYFIIFPLFLFINMGLFFLGILLMIYFYSKKMRKIGFFKKTTDKTFFGKNSIWFYISIVFFLYLDNIIQIYTVLELLFKGDKKFRKRKNIE